MVSCHRWLLLLLFSPQADCCWSFHYSCCFCHRWLIVAAYVIASPMLLLLLSMPLVDCYCRSIIGFRYFYYAVMVTVLYFVAAIANSGALVAAGHFCHRWLIVASFVAASCYCYSCHRRLIVAIHHRFIVNFKTFFCCYITVCCCFCFCHWRLIVAFWFLNPVPTHGRASTLLRSRSLPKVRTQRGWSLGQPQSETLLPPSSSLLLHRRRRRLFCFVATAIISLPLPSFRRCHRCFAAIISSSPPLSLSFCCRCHHFRHCIIILLPPSPSHHHFVISIASSSLLSPPSLFCCRIIISVITSPPSSSTETHGLYVILKANCLKSPSAVFATAGWLLLIFSPLVDFAVFVAAGLLLPLFLPPAVVAAFFANG